MLSDALLKVGSVVLLLGGLIFVHELGHFVVAKLLGVKVLRFSIGFGPRLFGFRRGETEYRISLLPLGGYVKMAGDDPSEEPAPEDRGRGFLEQAPWRRLVIALAGPTFNLVFPIAIYFALGVAQNGNLAPGPYVGTVAPGSPAAEAGLRPGDRVVSVAAPGEEPRPVRFFGDLPDVVSPHPRERLTFVVERGGKRIEPITIVPDAVAETNPIETKERGVIGVTPAFPPPLVAPVLPGAAGPLQPFDLVVRAGGKPVRTLLDLEQAIAAAACGPIDLDVVRERPVPLPGASVSTAEKASLPAVPTCRDGQPAIAPADPNISTYVASVVPGSPAAEAGLRRGDSIVAVNGTTVHTFRDIDALGAFKTPVAGKDPASPRRGEPVTLALRDGRTVTVTPTVDVYVDRLTKEHLERPLVGFQADRGALVDGRALVVEKVAIQRGLVEIAAAAWSDLVEVVRLTVLGIARIVTGHISFKTVGGPIMLFSIASDAVEEGLGSFLFKMALISVNLGLMNLLPIPVLDGGHIAAAIVESVTRRPLSVRAREIANIVGLILLFTLMLFVFKNDISRLLG